MTEGLIKYMTRAQAAMSEMSLAVVDDVVRLLYETWAHSRQVFVMGNGGSAATASHFVNDLNKTAIIVGKSRFRAIALNDNVPLITAWANDSSYEDIFAQQLLNYIENNDVLVGISTSGNSPNIINALRVGRAAGATTVGLTGLSGGRLKALVDFCVSVPTDDVMQIEGIHSVVLHGMVARFWELFADEELQRGENQPQSSGPRPAIFLDRDGVINENKEDYVTSWDEFQFLPGVLQPLKKLAGNKHAVVVVSNQSAIGRGLVTQEVVDKINGRMLEVIETAGGRVDGIFYCPHGPDEVCECRKPKPGLLLQAAQQLDLDLEKSVFIGDSLSDVQAAVEAGCTPIFVLTGRGREELPRLRGAGYNSIRIADNLAKAIEMVPVLEPHGTSDRERQDVVRSSDLGSRSWLYDGA